MRILFVSSGNKLSDISPIIKNQGESLLQAGMEIEYYGIMGQGWSGYLKNVFLLRRYLKNRHYDLVHAHYALSAVCAALAVPRQLPVVVSLMGSDLMLGNFWNMLINFFSNHSWRCTIVKSAAMKQKVSARQVQVIPNGVDIDIYKPLERESCRLKVNFTAAKNILFVGNPGRPEKNYALAAAAVQQLNDPAVKLQSIYGIKQADMVYYYNAADVLLLTSLWEGSPNVVKEALACNLPVVATAVGDVPELIDDVPGCYLAAADAGDIAVKIRLAFDLHSRSNGREKIIKMGLDSTTIAKRLISVYEECRITNY
jgi:teichuronic acid biosynthesis glycosyltransferase TuaC